MDGGLERWLEGMIRRVLREEIQSTSEVDGWLDQHAGPLTRNKHVRACRRLIRQNSPDAYYDASEGRWLIRSSAIDREIVRSNQELNDSGKLPESSPPPAMPAEPLRPLAKAGPEEDTGVYERSLLERALRHR